MVLCSSWIALSCRNEVALAFGPSSYVTFPSECVRNVKLRLCLPGPPLQKLPSIPKSHGSVQTFPKYPMFRSESVASLFVRSSFSIPSCNRHDLRAPADHHSDVLAQFGQVWTNEPGQLLSPFLLKRREAWGCEHTAPHLVQDFDPPLTPAPHFGQEECIISLSCFASLLLRFAYFFLIPRCVLPNGGKHLRGVLAVCNVRWRG